ncbi:MAG: hypothetical protein EA377_00240, partial [Phycisphaerales bacterium]
MRRPPHPIEHLGNFPTLVMCPDCGSDLREQPPAGQCPHCHMAYDERSWSVPIWIPRFLADDRDVMTPLLMMPLLALSAVLLALFAVLDALFNRPMDRPHGALIALPSALKVRRGRRQRTLEIPWSQIRGVTRVNEPSHEQSRGHLVISIQRRRVPGGPPALAEVLAVENGRGEA